MPLLMIRNDITKVKADAIVVSVGVNQPFGGGKNQPIRDGVKQPKAVGL